MFTDKPTTPVRLEALIDLVRNMSGRKLTVDTVKDLMQPSGLPGLSASSSQAADTLSAARQLDLIAEEEDGLIRLSAPRERRSSRDLILQAFDEKVLSSHDVEPWFSLFYAYVLGQNESAGAGQGKKWEIEFNNALFKGESVSNRFNETKYIGQRRWMRYVGLGWHDSEDAFQPNPYERVKRALPHIFSRAKALGADDFMWKLASHCPELDGGWIFKRANPGFDEQSRLCSGGLAHALVELHLDGVIALDCPLDSAGWSLEAAQPPRDGTLQSPQFAAVALSAAQKGN